MLFTHRTTWLRFLKSVATEISPEMGNFLRQSLASLIELDKHLGQDVCRTVLERLDAGSRFWFAPEVFQVLVASGAENSVQEWVDYNQPEDFFDRTSYLKYYAEIVKASQGIS
jgi:hypothetical protein